MLAAVIINRPVDLAFGRAICKPTLSKLKVLCRGIPLLLRGEALTYSMNTSKGEASSSEATRC